jgi:glutamine synthetase adenylyltransferase
MPSSSTGWPPVVKYLNENTTELGAAYRVDLRLRPDGSQGRR